MNEAVLSARDVRAMFELIGEVRELGEDVPAWRTRLTEGLSNLCGSVVSVAFEGIIRDEAPPATEEPSCRSALHLIDDVACGVSYDERTSFYDDVFWFDHHTDSTLDGLLPFYGTSFTRSRANLVDDATWRSSPTLNERFRRKGCGDFVVSMAVVPLSKTAMSTLALYRGHKDKPFGARETAILELVHDELAQDFKRVLGLDVKLTPRARDVLSCLTRGDSEKEIAASLGLSVHTVHDHIKVIHRAYKVRSRGELLGKISRTQRPAARLLTSA